MKITKFLGLLVLIAALGAAVVLVRRTQETRRGATSADIEALFLPDTKSVGVGEAITSTFVLDTKTHKLTGVEVRIKYDAARLTVKEVNPVIVGVTAGTALFKAESDVLSKSIDESKGLITLAGISMEEDVTKMAMGAVSLIKIVFEAKAAGSAQVTLDGTYDNMATGYNPSSSDQSLAIKTIKPATYTISSTSLPTVTVRPRATSTPRPTAVSTVRPTVTVMPTKIPTATIKPTGVLSCKWCGTNCVSSGLKMMCPDVMPPVGKKCTVVSGQCAIVPATITPTSGVGLGCNQRCTVNTKCGSGLTCVPLWWPTPCGEIPKTILDKVERGTALNSTDVSTVVRLCPEVKNTLLSEADRNRVNDSGTVTGSALSVMPPVMIGVCRNQRCTKDTDCVCGGTVTPVVTPRVTGVARCSCPSGVPAKKTGNANCDDKTSALDFEIWRSEAFDQGGIEGKIKSDWKADFNCDQKVNLSDFEIWRTSVFDVKSSTSAVSGRATE